MELIFSPEPPHLLLHLLLFAVFQLKLIIFFSDTEVKQMSVALVVLVLVVVVVMMWSNVSPWPQCGSCTFPVTCLCHQTTTSSNCLRSQLRTLEVAWWWMLAQVWAHTCARGAEKARGPAFSAAIRSVCWQWCLAKATVM